MASAAACRAAAWCTRLEQTLDAGHRRARGLVVAHSKGHHGHGQPHNSNSNGKATSSGSGGSGGAASSNGSVPPEELWDSALPEYMQNQGVHSDMCESWEDMLRQGEAGGGTRTSSTIWDTICKEAEADAGAEPLLSSFLYASILSHDNFERSLAFVLSNRLSDATFLATELFEVFYSILRGQPEISDAALADLCAVRERDPACMSYSQALLHYKGFHAIQAHRIAHELWTRGRKVMAAALQSRMSEVFAVDIHPAARFGRGILIDHGTGVVIGETAELGNNVSILQNVTLGGTGKVHGDRHPKISDNVLIGASASILGNIRIGKGAQVAAGSLVLKPVPPRTLVAGSPAREIGQLTGNPAENMEQWSVSSKELLKSNLEKDPFATTSGSRVVPSSDTPSSSSASSSGGGDAPAEQRGTAAAAPSAASQVEAHAAAAAADAVLQRPREPSAAAKAAADAVPQRPRDPSAAAKAAAQQTAGSKVDAALSEREARRKWGGDMPPPEFII